LSLKGKNSCRRTNEIERLCDGDDDRRIGLTIKWFRVGDVWKPHVHLNIHVSGGLLSDPAASDIGAKVSLALAREASALLDMSDKVGRRRSRKTKMA
jgi:hypothetical protein